MVSEEIDKRTEAVEGVLRETASRQGLLLRKSRTDGTYRLVDANTNIRVEGGQNTSHGLDLETVAAKLGLQVMMGENGPSLVTWARR